MRSFLWQMRPLAGIGIDRARKDLHHLPQLLLFRCSLVSFWSSASVSMG